MNHIDAISGKQIEELPIWVFNHSLMRTHGTKVVQL